VVLEGGDGAGKSTQVAMLTSSLRRNGFTDVVRTREPGGTAVGERIRDLLLHGGHVAPRAEALLYAADRAHHVAEVIRPALARGAIVLADRFVDSSIAYQAGARGLPEAEILAINEVATGGLTPDVTVVLDLAPELGAHRRRGSGDRIESEAITFHALVRERYLALAARHPDRYLVVAADRSPEVVHQDVLAATMAVLAGSNPAPEAVP
jgi:dTMP kinase